MSTWTSLRVLPLMAAVAFAAGCKDDEKDGPKTDTEDTEDTADTADTSEDGTDAFLPSQLSYQAYFAVDEAGQIAPYSIAGGASAEPSKPFFAITLSDERDDACVLIYEVKPEAWGHVGQVADPDTDGGGDTDAEPVEAGPEDLLKWLADNKLFFGWRIGPDDYEPLFLNSPDSRCADLPEGFQENPHGAFFDFTWDPSAGGKPGVGFIGFKTEVDDELVSFYEGTDITEEQLLGGRLGFPFKFGTPTGESNFFEITATWGLLDDDGKATVDAQIGLPDPAAAAADAWDGTQPSEGFYFMFSPSVLQVTVEE